MGLYLRNVQALCITDSLIKQLVSALRFIDVMSTKNSRAIKAYKKIVGKLKVDDLTKIIGGANKAIHLATNHNKFKEYLNDLKLSFSLVKDYYFKEYTKVSFKTVLAIAGALAYILWSLDIIPDFIPFTGFLDDIGVFTYAMTLVGKELKEYEVWKKQQESVQVVEIVEEPTPSK